jgi:protein SCO1/2
MEGFLKRHGFKLAAGVIIILIAAAFVSTQLKSRSQYKVIKQAPSFQLTDIEGKNVSMADGQGKVRLVYFFYSNCPDVCSPTTYFMSQVQQGLMDKKAWGTKTAFYSITIDPVRDTPQQLADFSGHFRKAKDNWYFLRGDEQATWDLAAAYGVSAVKDKDGNFMHSNVIVLVDKKGYIRNYYNASDENLDPASIVNDMIDLSKE